MKECELTVVKLIMYNFLPLFKQRMLLWRWEVSTITNSNSNIEEYSIFDKFAVPYFDKFIKHIIGRPNVANRPFNNELRIKVMKKLFMGDDCEPEKPPAYKYFTNMYAQFTFLLILLIAGIRKRNSLFIGVSAAILFHAMIIILFASEAIWSYLLGIYMCACIFMTILLLGYIRQIKP